MKKTAVIVIDVQCDFTESEKGSLAVTGSGQNFIDEVRRATEELKQAGYSIFATQDWHPQTHISFYTSHESKKAFDRISIGGMERVLWPPHCVKGTRGVELLVYGELFDGVVKKGEEEEYDSYSGFKDERGTETPLHCLLQQRGISQLIVYGIATDYCVRATVMDAVELGYEVMVMKDLTRGVDPETTRNALEEMQKHGVVILEKLDLEKIGRLTV